MANKLCGMCFGNFSNLKQHLRECHTIPNREEFQLLMKYGLARTPKNLDCEICGKKTLVRLDKHLQDSHNMGSKEERELIMREAKRAAIVKELAKLRESDPDVPMVSTLDMGNTAKHDYNTPPVCGKQFEEPVEDVQDENKMEPNYLDFHLSSDSAENIDPPSENNLTTRCSTPIPLKNDERNLSSSDPHESTSQPLPSSPVSGSHNSSSSPLHQHPSIILPMSMNPPSCESELPSSNLPGHLSGQNEHLTASSDPHESASQPLFSNPVPGFNNSFSSPLHQRPSIILPMSMNPPSCESELGHLSGQTEHLTASSNPHESASQPLFSSPVPGFNNSFSSPLHQRPSIILPMSMNPPSCESELPSSNLPGHLSGQTEHLTASSNPHESASQPLFSSPVPGFNNSFSSPLHQRPSIILPMSMNPPSCESELSSSNLPGHLSGQTEHLTASSDPHESASQPLFSSPVPGFNNSFSSPLHQRSSIILPMSMNPPSCESELPSSNLPGHLSGQSEHLTASSNPHEITSQPLFSSPVPGFNKSSSSPLHQHPSIILPMSMNPPSCESELPSSNLPGHLSGQTEHLTASSDPHENASQPLFSSPVPGFNNSFSSPLHQRSSIILPMSMNPPSCESELPSSNLPGHLSGQSEHLTASSNPHEITSQPLFSSPVPGFNKSSSSPLHQHPSIILPMSMNPPSCESELPSSNLPGHLSGQNENLTGTMTKVCSCISHWEEFESRLQLLEQKMDRMMTVQPQTLKSLPWNPSLSAQKGEHIGKGKTSRCLFEKIVQDFVKFRLGPRTGKKDRDNAKTSSSHAHRFCLYMAAGLPSSSICHDLRFLNQVDRLHVWPTYLAQKGYAPTSIKIMVSNVIMFFKHVENSFQVVSQLEQKELRDIQDLMKRIQAEVQKQVVVYQPKVLRQKTENQLDAVQESKLMMATKAKRRLNLSHESSQSEVPKKKPQLNACIPYKCSVVTDRLSGSFEENHLNKMNTTKTLPKQGKDCLHESVEKQHTLECTPETPPEQMADTPSEESLEYASNLPIQ
ncbi:uncharacterized protein LOC113133723 [Mastacembelus armatus]|uniref:uncharacterized protein LOC113133723 n=1 Tax=Mastacembelus armatus TaxID=205130 RepID=UPI000E45AB13|nr:uncharacterized protein LOC113133723 [Mastacembelus armatus]